MRFRITVNSREHDVIAPGPLLRLTYGAVVALVRPVDPYRLYHIVYGDRAWKTGGELPPGQSVDVADGAIFYVADW